MKFLGRDIVFTINPLPLAGGGSEEGDFQLIPVSNSGKSNSGDSNYNSASGTKGLERIARLAIGEKMDADVAISRLEFHR